jgi:hypothetical protein
MERHRQLRLPDTQPRKNLPGSYAPSTSKSPSASAASAARPISTTPNPANVPAKARRLASAGSVTQFHSPPPQCAKPHPTFSKIAAFPTANQHRRLRRAVLTSLTLQSNPQIRIQHDSQRFAHGALTHPRRQQRIIRQHRPDPHQYRIAPRAKPMHRFQRPGIADRQSPPTRALRFSHPPSVPISASHTAAPAKPI